MKAMVLNKICMLSDNRRPLTFSDMPTPTPQDGEILVKVSACGVCHTELDEIEGRTLPPEFPVIPGHQVVGLVEDNGQNKKFQIGDQVGIAWIYSACGHCNLCKQGYENLCTEFRATGRDAHGGYAEYMTVAEDFAYLIPNAFSAAQAAPLLCAGAIGYRSLCLSGMSEDACLGLTGFGASAHLVLKMVRHKYPRAQVFVFARSPNERKFACDLGAVWAGDTGEPAPRKLDCIIDTTPVWRPIVEALNNLKRGGRLVINAIRKEDVDQKELLRLDYPKHLWMEKEIKSVANVTRRDVREFLQLAAAIPLKPEIQKFSLEQANEALLELKERKIRGAKVLVME